MHQPRIAIVGTGAIGGFYGMMLARSGADVHFLARSEYQTIAEQGLTLNSQHYGRVRLEHPQLYQDPANMPPCDWILLATKTTSNPTLVETLLKIAAPNARIILLQNGLGVEDDLRPHLPSSLHLLGGLCFVCVHRVQAGVIEHQALGSIHLAYHSGTAQTAEARQNILEELAVPLRASGIEVSVMPDLTTARWQKLVWNAAYNGPSVVLNAHTNTLMHNPNSLELVKGLMQEVMRAAQACGHPLPPELPQQMLNNTLNLPDYLPSMYHDYQQHRPMELEAIYQRPIQWAAEAGCSLPKMEQLLQCLRFLEQHHP